VGVRERKREKVKEEEEDKSISPEEKAQKPVVQSALDQKEPTLEETHAPGVTVEETEVQDAPVAEEPTTENVEADATEVLEKYLAPPWGGIDESEWMYGIPTRQTDLNLWAEEWGDYLLQWAESNSVHVLSIATFIAEPPFKDMRSKVEAFRTISEGLIEKRVAEWVDKNERQLRIYWKPLEDWADEIYVWCLEKGKLRLDVKSIVIQEDKEAFAQLPEADLYKVMGILVSKKLADWVEKKRGAITVKT
jgi:hypothetical protein